MYFQKLSLLNLASEKKVLVPTTKNTKNADDSFEYVPPKVSRLFSSVSCLFV